MFHPGDKCLTLSRRHEFSANRPLTKPLFYTKTAQPLYFIPPTSKNFSLRKILEINPNRETHGKRSLY